MVQASQTSAALFSRLRKQGMSQAVHRGTRFQKRSGLRQAYRDAKVILRIRIRGSTVFAGRPGKLVFSVESDRGWALELQRTINDADLAFRKSVVHVDIGTTGSGAGQRMPTPGVIFIATRHIWSEPFFRSQRHDIGGQGSDLPARELDLDASQPITICLTITALARCTTSSNFSVTGFMSRRMAVFKVTPQEWPKWSEDLLMELCTMVSFEADDVDYGKVPDISFLQDAISH